MKITEKHIELIKEAKSYPDRKIPITYDDNSNGRRFLLEDMCETKPPIFKETKVPKVKSHGISYDVNYKLIKRSTPTDIDELNKWFSSNSEKNEKTIPNFNVNGTGNNVNINTGDNNNVGNKENAVKISLFGKLKSFFGIE